MPLERNCPRCHNLLVTEDDNALVFCAHCGAPQVWLSEELRSATEELATQESHPETAVTGQDVFGTPAPSGVPWDSLIRIAALLSVIFALFAVFFPPLAFFVAPAAISLFATRHREVRFTAALGTRVGLLCGIFCSLMASLLEAVAMVTLRLSSSGVNPIDERLSAVRDQVIAQSGEAMSKGFPMLFNPALFNIAEFRSGMVLGTFAVMMGIVILFTTAGGTLAGYLRSRNRTA